MNILFVISSLGNGGAERVAAVLCNSLAERGHTVHCMVFNKRETEYRISEKVDVVYLRSDSETNQWKARAKRLLQGRRIIKQIKPDVMVGFMGAGYNAFFGSCGFCFPKIASVRANPSKETSKLMRYWFSHADAVVLQCADQERAYSGRFNNPVVIGNPVSDDSLLHYRKENYQTCRRIVMAGRLSHVKDYPAAICALSKVRAIHSDVTLDIYHGAGSAEKEIKDAITKYHMEDVVRLCGWTDNTPAALCNYDLYLLTSLSEGMPNALMEAMAVGLPCISTDCETGPAELITDGVNGFLTKVGDPDVLAEKIVTVINMTAEQRAELGNRAHEAMYENYRTEVIIQKWEALFRDLIRKARRQA